MLKYLSEIQFGAPESICLKYLFIYLFTFAHQFAVLHINKKIITDYLSRFMDQH